MCIGFGSFVCFLYVVLILTNFKHCEAVICGSVWSFADFFLHSVCVLAIFVHIYVFSVAVTQ